MHATATQILPRLWIGTDYSCHIARELGARTLCVLEKPCDEGCYHLPITTAVSPLGVVEGVDPEKLEEAVARLAEMYFIADGSTPVLVHCAAGMERSPLVVAHFLVDYFRVSLDEAYAWIKAHRPIVQDRRAWVRNYRQSLLDKF